MKGGCKEVTGGTDLVCWSGLVWFGLGGSLVGWLVALVGSASCSLGACGAEVASDGEEVTELECIQHDSVLYAAAFAPSGKILAVLGKRQHLACDWRHEFAKLCVHACAISCIT